VTTSNPPPPRRHGSLGEEEDQLPAKAAAEGFRVRWGVLSTIFGVITLTSLGALVVVTSVKDVDTLSVVALSLAVLSFVAQLIVTMAQAQQSSQVSSETMGALAEMRATTTSLLTNQREQFDAVLKFAFQQAIPAVAQDIARSEAAESGTDAQSEETGERASEVAKVLQTSLEEVLSNWQPATSRSLFTSRFSGPPPSTSSVSERGRARREWRDLISNFPTREEGEPAVQVLRGLKPRTLARFGSLTDDIGDRGRPDQSVSYPRAVDQTAPSKSMRQLIDAGLVEEVSAPPPGETGPAVYRMTPRGVIAARLIRGQGEPPDWAVEVVG
jgi:hypothetical protein